MQTYAVMQDGADFYLNHPETEELAAVVSYPQGVHTYEEAEDAREWFKRLTERWGWKITF